MIPALILLIVSMLCAAVGNLFVSHGMKKVGELQNYKIKTLLRFFWKAVTSWSVVVGIIISAGYFFLWLGVLSLADVSWALPMNAIEYIFVAVGAIFFLKEKVSLSRWVGVGLISVGVLFLLKSW